MENKKLNVLVVDDHPIIADAYISLISSSPTGGNYTFQKAKDCYSASRLVNLATKLVTPFDVAIIDINIPECKEEKLFSGKDIALMIRKKFPDCLILMLTMHSEPMLLFSVYKQVKPEGFISKNDVDFELFPQIFNKVITEENHYTPTINRAIKSLLKQTIKWDEYDAQIILFLSQGIQTKELPNYIELSLSAIEKRKANIKRQILDQKVSDKELIEECKLLKLI